MTRKDAAIDLMGVDDCVDIRAIPVNDAVQTGFHGRL